MKELAGHQLNNRNKINIMNICKLTATIVLSLFGFAQAEEPYPNKLTSLSGFSKLSVKSITIMTAKK